MIPFNRLVPQRRKIAKKARQRKYETGYVEAIENARAFKMESLGPFDEDAKHSFHGIK